MGQGTMFKFVASDGIGSSQKRHQARRACESCRRRKKACHHTEPPTSSKLRTASDNNSARSPTPSSYGTTTEQQGDEAQVQAVTQESTQAAFERESPIGADANTIPQETTNDIRTDLSEGSSHQLLNRQEDPNSRFIGDLNPEGIFLAATSPDATRGGKVGVWLTTNTNMTTSQTPQHTLKSPSNLFHGTSSLIQQIFVPMLEQQCRSAIPSTTNVIALTKIYFDKVYPLLPIIEAVDYQGLSPTDPHLLLLQQGICLAASKNFAARHHLVIDEDTQPLGCREFGERLSGAMRMSIEMGLVTNKVVIIQALGLLTQFADNPVSDDLSSQLCSRAVHHLQSLGLQVRDDQATSTKRVFCCIWAIDKLNAAIYGRPVMMYERDLSPNYTSYFEAQEPSFRLLLLVVELLDKVIDIFRPTSEDPILTWDFPSFEDVVLKCGMPHIGMSTLSTIETLYHATSILSCRSKTWADPQRSSPSYLRQSLSTAILSSTVSRQLQDHQLTLFPFIPYAMSLAMSIAYREMRHSMLTLQRTRSRLQFQILCDALSKLSGVFWSASATSEMGNKLLKEMDRVVSTVPSRAPPATETEMSNNNNTMNENGNGSGFTPIQDIDPSFFGSVPDIDLFGMFDPAFDLDGFDACLEGNLNPAFPTNFQ